MGERRTAGREVKIFRRLLWQELPWKDRDSFASRWGEFAKIAAAYRDGGARIPPELVDALALAFHGESDVAARISQAARRCLEAAGGDVEAALEELQVLARDR